MTPDTARLAAAYAALQAVDRAQRQWLACAMDVVAMQHGPKFYDADRYAQVSDAEGEARSQLATASQAATAALAAVGVALEASPPANGDLAHLIAQEHETAAALGCCHPDDEGE